MECPSAAVPRDGRRAKWPRVVKGKGLVFFKKRAVLQGIWDKMAEIAKMVQNGQDGQGKGLGHVKKRGFLQGILSKLVRISR